MAGATDASRRHAPSMPLTWLARSRAVHTAGLAFPAFVTQLDQTAGGVGDRPQLHLAGGYTSAIASPAAALIGMHGR